MTNKELRQNTETAINSAMQQIRRNTNLNEHHRLVIKQIEESLRQIAVSAVLDVQNNCNLTLLAMHDLKDVRESADIMTRL